MHAQMTLGAVLTLAAVGLLVTTDGGASTYDGAAVMQVGTAGNATVPAPTADPGQRKLLPPGQVADGQEKSAGTAIDAPTEELETNESAPAESGAPLAGAVIPISGEISNVTVESLRRRVDQAIAAGAKVVVFEIDTPGGLVSSALDICDYIKNLESVKTVAWVNTQAYSAGSMIAVACDEIVMSASSVVGDCGVILGGPTGPQEVPEELRAKVESPVLEQFRDSATRHGYDLLLSESLVVKERVVWWIEHKETKDRRFVSDEEKKSLVDGVAGDSPFAAGNEQDASEWQLVTSYFDPVGKRDVPITQPVVSATELLTMSQSRAMAFGFCKDIIRNTDELRSRYNLDADLARYDTNWSERFTGWLTSMPVRMFLLVIILLGAYVEFNTPGVGVPGLVALICLGIFVGAPYVSGLANFWEILLVLIGFALIAVEIFVIPGFGIAGVSGILCVIVGLLATFVPDEPGRDFPIYWPRWDAGVEALKYGAITLAGGTAAGIASMILFSKMLPRIPWLQGVVPANPVAAQIEVTDPYLGYARVGDVGVVESTLRPAGKARFGSVLVDVVSEGEFIDPPGSVEVVERRGNRVVVRRLRQA